MNIIKVADVKPELVSEELREKYLLFKNLYCYCINWKYIVNFDDVKALADEEQCSVSEEYIKLSLKDNIIDFFEEKQVVYALYSDYVFNNLVDIALTEKSNSIAKFIEFNEFNPDDKELTLEQIKAFRTWLASCLYSFLKDEQDTPYETLEMLNYYANEMSDDTIKHLSHFSVSPSVSVLSSKSSCSCSQTSAALVAASTSISSCDPISMYRKAIYQYMVTVFSDIKFWSEREDEFITEFKKYIDAIIKLNLHLTSSQYVSELYDCNCLTIADSAQNRLIGILKNLSTALGYISSGDLNGHKNFISDTLYEWSTKLYEIMRW